MSERPWLPQKEYEQTQEYKQNKAKWGKQKYECPCGAVVSKWNYTQHYLSKKHARWEVRTRGGYDARTHLPEQEDDDPKICPCGGKLSTNDKKHYNTKLHLNYLIDKMFFGN